jgi:hypothetical protein
MGASRRFSKYGNGKSDYELTIDKPLPNLELNFE